MQNGPILPTLPCITLQDAENNRLKQWLNAPLLSGVFEAKFQLAKLPPLGTWSIFAEMSGEVSILIAPIAERFVRGYYVCIGNNKMMYL